MNMICNSSTKRLEGTARRQLKRNLGICKQGYAWYIYNVENKPLSHWSYLGNSYQEAERGLYELDAIWTDQDAQEKEYMDRLAKEFA